MLKNTLFGILIISSTLVGNQSTAFAACLGDCPARPPIQHTYHCERDDGHDGFELSQPAHPHHPTLSVGPEETETQNAVSESALGT